MDETLRRMLKDDLDRGVAACRRELDRQLFASALVSGPVVPARPISRSRRIWWGVRGYCSTLWDALCGRDLVRASESDDY